MGSSDRFPGPFFCPAVGETAETLGALSGSTLILPSVTTGNIPQLALDVVLTTLLNSCKVQPSPAVQEPLVRRVGFLHHPAILPINGNDALFLETPEESRRGRKQPKKKSSSNNDTPPAFQDLGRGLTMPVEVWFAPKLRLTFVHQRSPPLLSRQKSFFAALWRWILDSEFSSVLLLSSAGAENQLDRDMNAIGSGRFYAAQISPGSEDADQEWRSVIQRMGWTPVHWPVDGKQQQQQPSDAGEAKESEDRADLVLEKGPSAFLRSAPEPCPPLRVLNTLSFEGDNSRDAILMASQISKAFFPAELSELRAVLPSSWALMFGGPPPSGIYL